MGIAVKVAIGLVLLLPMTGYVVGSLVAAADPPREHAPIIVQEQPKAPKKPSASPSAKPTEKPSEHGKGRGHDQSEDPGDDNTPEIVTPSPSELFDDHGGLDNSGKGSGGDSSGKGSGDD